MIEHYVPQAHSECLVPWLALDMCDVWWDESWANDACANLVLLIGDRLYELWSDYPDVERRTGPECTRYSISPMSVGRCRDPRDRTKPLVFLNVQGEHPDALDCGAPG